MSQQWEYCAARAVSTGVSSVFFYTPAGDTIKRFFTSRRELTTSTGDLTWENMIALLGVKGWEIAGVGADAYQIYLKRPIEPGRRIDDAF